MDFQPKGLQPDHPYLLNRGFTRETIRHFGLGYCARGLMAGRVAIPIRDGSGRLVGYAGRIVEDAAVSETVPKYKFPSKRERDGVVHEFRKSHLLYNANFSLSPVEHLIVVEGFPSVWWLHQAGYPNVVALMGSSCSEEQAALILAKTTQSGRVTVLSDGDEAGNRCALSVFERVAQERWVRWSPLSGGTQPTDCHSEELKTLVRA